MATEQSQNDNSSDSQNTEELQKKIDEFLMDPATRTALLEKLTPQLTAQNTGTREGAVPFPYPTLSGTSAGSGWPVFPVPFPLAPAPGFPPFWGRHADAAGEQSTPSTNNEDVSDPPAFEAGSSGLQNTSDEDIIEPLGDAEALELVEFDPAVESEESWIPPQPILAFVEKHFGKGLAPGELEKIVKDFPKPQCRLLETPTLDDQVRDHLKKLGKDPHFGAEKSLYKLQGSILDFTGPLTCLWADLLDTKTKVRREEVILLIQRILLMVADLSHSVSQERRQIAWSRLNPVIKDISLEDKKEKSATLFGDSFMEKAAKRIEEEKTLAKFTNSPKEPPPPKRRKYTQDPTDLRRFLEKGAPAQYGSRKHQRQQPYNHNQNRKQNFKRSQPQQQFRPPNKKQ